MGFGSLRKRIRLLDIEKAVLPKTSPVRRTPMTSYIGLVAPDAKKIK